MKKVYRADPTCQNCGTPVNDKYCPHCGQENIELHVPFLSFITHLVADFFHFDSKFFKTISPLIFKPGKLSKEFLAGKRRAYLDPVRMYIFVSIIFFGMGAFIDHRSEEATNQGSIRITQSPAEIIQMNGDSAGKSLAIQKGDMLLDSASQNSKENNFDLEARALIDSMRKEAGTDKVQTFLLDKLDEKYVNSGGKLNEFKNALTEKSRDSLPKTMFVLLPIFALILKAFYRSRHFVDHAVVSLHIHTAIFILLTLNNFVRLWSSLELVKAAIIIYAMIYLLMSLKRVYERSWKYTIFACTGIVVVYVFVSSMILLMSVFFAFLMM